MLQDVLQELSETAQKSGISDAANHIITNINCTMSDRAAAQKSFNALLATYRAEILPDVVKNWEGLTGNEQMTISQMHNFYCGMHLVVNMAEHTSESLKLIEKNYESPTTHAVYTTNEPGSVRLVRTVCKAFERRGDAKSGCPIQFATYLKKQGIPKNPLVHFRGNRFNILFANGARVYHLHQHIAGFLESWGTPNRLLQAVLEDVTNPINIAGSKALGLIDKHITGPLWRILESDIHVLDIPQHYAEMKDFFEKSAEDNIGLFMTGEDIPFKSEFVKKDEVWRALVSPSNHDAITGNMLLSMFKAFELLLDRVLTDLHPVIQAEEENEEEVRAKTKSVPTTNTISERDFAKFDRLIREKPHASTLALEAHILFTNNKTSKWLNQKSIAERSKMMEEARTNAPYYRKVYRQRISRIEKENSKRHDEKVKKNQEAERKLIEAKEKITTDIISHGLWQSISQMDSCLSGIKSETQKRAAIKIQLRFRKTVLQQVTSDLVYNFSSKEKGPFNSQLLRENLAKLIHSADVEATPASSLIGRAIRHKFESNGKNKFYKGRVITQVPGFPEWFNVVYNNEPEIVYSYRLSEDIERGDLQVL